MIILLGYGEQIMCQWSGVVDATLRKSCILSEVEKVAQKAITEGFVAVVRSKIVSPTWSDVRTALMDFDRAGLRGLVQDLYAASKDNRAFLHARLGLGHDQLQPFKASISKWIFPDVVKGQPISVSKAKKAIADYKKAIGRPNGMAELSIFYCEEAFRFLESCSIEDESYFGALIRMYGRSIEFVSRLPPAERTTYIERLDKLSMATLDHAGGTSAGRSKKNSIAFGTLPLWTSTTVNEGPFCRTR
jgi:hypothetical protein